MKKISKGLQKDFEKIRPLVIFNPKLLIELRFTFRVEQGFSTVRNFFFHDENLG